MTQEQKDRWVAALRSGEFRQGTGALYKPEPNTFCCLGVALAVFESDPDWEFGYESLERKYKLTNATIDRLICLNDGSHYNFKAIADWIEVNLEVTE